ncbi:MAG: hypothetical protein CMJ67_08040 [Planctomycetaceae bacterium]|nr:hypothetical protein [Planctomycetaceae bacterium]
MEGRFPESFRDVVPGQSPAPTPNQRVFGNRSSWLKYKPGERVRHPGKPEWGVGEVTKVELITRDGMPDRRVWIRFPSEGTKTVLSSVAGLELVEDSEESGSDSGTMLDRQSSHETGWLGQIAKNKPEDAMTSLPDRATDPFMPPRARLEFIYGLYRFNRNGGSLIEWAIAQSGLDDPMSRFNRHELEQFFDRWSWERDRTLARTLEECRKAGDPIDILIKQAPPAARRGLKKAAPPR